MSRRVVWVIFALSVVVLAVSGGAYWWAQDQQRRVSLVASQQDAYAGARSAIRTVGCAKAKQALAQVVSGGGDPATVRAASADQKLCATLLAARAGWKQAQPDALLGTYLTLLSADPSPEIADQARSGARAVLTRAAARGRLTDVTCGNYERLLAEGILNRGEGALTDYRYLVGCWGRLRTRQPEAAHELLIAIQQQITRGAKAQFPGPQSFTGGGRVSRVTVINAGRSPLYVTFAGIKGAYRLDLPACSARCSPGGAQRCTSNAVRTLSLPPGDYWTLLSSDATGQLRQGGSRSNWELNPGRSTTCVH
jgi:hypothetical protein